jgi:hypothetical protein
MSLILTIISYYSNLFAKVKRIFEFCKYLAKKIRERGFGCASLPFCYAPTQLVAPRAVRMADAMEAISWITNFTVSFFVIVVCF